MFHECCHMYACLCSTWLLGAQRSHRFTAIFWTLRPSFLSSSHCLSLSLPPLSPSLIFPCQNCISPPPPPFLLYFTSSCVLKDELQPFGDIIRSPAIWDTKSIWASDVSREPLYLSKVHQVFVLILFTQCRYRVNIRLQYTVHLQHCAKLHSIIGWVVFF